MTAHRDFYVTVDRRGFKLVEDDAKDFFQLWGPRKSVQG